MTNPISRIPRPRPWPRARRGQILVMVAITLDVVLTGVAGAGAAGVVVPPQNPASDLWAAPTYTFTPLNDHSYRVGAAIPACWAWARGSFVARPTGRRCVPDEVAATDRAQHSEGLGNISLPSNFAKLSAPDQLLVLTDIERVSRGEAPVLGVSDVANAVAQQGATERTDPVLSLSTAVSGATGSFGSNYAAGVNALDANYQWMYTDGWDGKYTFNGACTTSSSPGCWGHRDNILANQSNMPCEAATCSVVMGAGFVHLGSGRYNSYTEIFVQVSGTILALAYTWRQAVAAGARG